MPFMLQSVGILCQHGFEVDTPSSSREALKCVANILLLESKTRSMFVEFGYAPKAAAKLKVTEPLPLRKINSKAFAEQ